MSFTIEERIFIVIHMAKFDESPTLVERQWKRDVNRKPPSHNTMRSIFKKFKETGSVQDAQKPGAPKRNDAKEEEIQTLFETKPSTSIRQAAQVLSTSYSCVQRTLQDVGLKNFHVQTVQAITEVDKAARLAMCEETLHRISSNSSYLSNVVFSDEATFFVQGTVNKHNCRVWGYENPHLTMQRPFQSPKVTVWAALTSKHLIGPYFFDTNVNKEKYLSMLQEFLIPQLKQRRIYSKSIFHQDGAPPHWGLNVRKFLNEQFPNRWWGRDGPINWSPRSPDLTPLDYFLWGYLRDQVFATPITNIDDLKSKITAEFVKINQSNMLQRVVNSLQKRMELCMQNEGGIFENLL